MLSIAIHLFAARVVRWTIASPVEPPESTTIARMIVVKIAQHTPPPRTPQPAASRPPAAHKAQTHINVPPVAASGEGPGKSVAMAPPSPTAPAASPTPRHSPTPAPSASAGGCLKTNAPAAVSSPAPVPEIPASARAPNVSGIAQIHVSLSDVGAVLNATVQVGSGNAELDSIAVNMARAAIYTPNVVACKRVASEYVYRVKFATK
ncbi:MAG: hypothetical protein DLM50_03395 [Candidatus Meridianibacter frigidus]|nr:MAG: hypothetical protein DLM50_03395 [Candidatus Eremiobacteraeota bacterium]